MSYFDRARYDRSMPCIPYTMHTNEGHPMQVFFTITLQGSWIPLVRREASMGFVCAIRESRPVSIQTKKEHKVILLVSEMYGKTSSFICAIQGKDLDYKLTLESYECCVLLCELSFHLPNWAKVGYELGIDKEETSRLRTALDGEYAYEATHAMLCLWIERSSHPPSLQTLLGALHRCNVELRQCTWKQYYDISHLNAFNERAVFLLLKDDILSLWKFVARLLGLNSDQIYEVEVNHKGDEKEIVYQMLLKWRMTSSGQSDRELYEQVFKALHCIRQHTGKLRDTLNKLLKINS